MRVCLTDPIHVTGPPSSLLLRLWIDPKAVRKFPPALSVCVIRDFDYVMLRCINLHHYQLVWVVDQQATN